MVTRNTRGPTSDRRIALALALVIALVVIVGWWLLRAPSSNAHDMSAEVGPLAASSTTTSTTSRSRERARLEPRDTTHAAATTSSATELASASDAPALTYIVSGSVRDERTSEPVPELTVELFGGETHETVRTDAAGQFASTREFPSGEVRAELSDLGEAVGAAKLAHAALPFDIAVRIGPTYPLAIAPIVPNGRLQVRLSECTTGAYAAILDLDKQGRLTLAPLERRDWGAALVRPGTRPWVRFPHANDELDDRWSAWLMLEDERGQRWCEARAHGTRGVRPLVSLSTELGCASIVGKVLQATASARDVFVCAVPDNPDDRDVLGWHRTRANVEGDYELAGLHGGSWRVVAYARGLFIDQAIVDLAPHATAFANLRLAAPSVDVSVVTTSSQREITLWSATLPELEPFLPPFIGIGPLDDVPRAPLRVAAWTIGKNLRDFSRFAALQTWPGSGELQRVAAPATAELRMFFELPASSVGSAWYALGPGGSIDGVFDGSRAVTVNPDEPLEWLAGAHDCAPVFGRLDDAVRGSDGLTLRVSLSAGWGAQICAEERGVEHEDVRKSIAAALDRAHTWELEEVVRALERTRAPPIHGFSIAALGDSVDGEPLEWSVPRAVGDAFIALDAPPQHLGVRLDRTRFAVRALEPNFPTTPRGKRQQVDLNRHRLVCERLERAVVLPRTSSER